MALRGVYVPVMASMRGFSGPIISGASRAARQASQGMSREFGRGGSRAGQAAAEGLAAQQRAIERVAAQLAGARDQEANAAGALRIAETKLRELRESGTATAAQLVRAEEQVSAARRRQATAQGRVTTAEEELENTRNGTAGSSRAVIRAEQQLQAARDRSENAVGAVRTAETQLAELRLNGGSATQIARAEERVETARRGAVRATDQVTTAEAQLAAAQEEAAEAARRQAGGMDEGGDAADGFSDRIGNLAKQLGTLAAAGAGIGGISAAIGTAIDNDKLNDKLAAQLGATPEMAQNFGKIAGDLYSQAYGDSMEDVNEAIRGVWQQGLLPADATNDQIKSVTASVMNLASTFDQDLAGSTAAVGTLIKNGLAPDAQSALDILTKGFQNGADKGEDLLDTMTEYPALFKSMGLSGQDAMGLINQAMQNGARNSDLVADSLKEFTLQIQGQGSATTSAIEKLGFNAQDMYKKFAAGGDSAKEVFAQLQHGLMGVKDPMEKGQIALGLYGTKFEDMQSAIYGMDPTNAVQSLGDVTGAAQKMGETLGDNDATRIESFKRTMQTLAATMGGKLIGALHSSAKYIQQNKTAFIAIASAITVFVLPALIRYGIAQAAAAGSSAASAIMNIAKAWRLQGIATKAATAAQWLWNTAFAASGIGTIIVVLAAVGVALWAFFTKTETGRKWWKKIWGGIKSAMSVVVDWFTKTAWPAIKSAFGWVADKALWLWHKIIEPAFNGIKTAIGWVIDHWKLFAMGFGIALGPVGIVIGLLITQFDKVKAAVRFVGDAAMWMWHNAFEPAFNGIKLAAQTFWTGITVIFGWFKTGVDGLAAAGMWLWHTIFEPVWAGMKWTVEMFWRGVTVVFGWFKTGVDGLGNAVTWLWHNAAEPAWNGIKTGAEFMWSGVTGIFDFFKKGIDALGDAGQWLWHEVFEKVWNGIKTGLETAWSGIEKVFGFIKDGMSKVGDIVRKVGDGMRSAFDGLAGILKEPIHVVGGLLKKIPGKIGPVKVPFVGSLHDWGESLAGLKSGGAIRDKYGRLTGPGTGTSDSIVGVDARGIPIVRVATGETVVTEKASSDPVNAAAMSFMNAGGSLAPFLKTLPGLADGGTVGYGLPTGTNTGGFGSSSPLFPKWVHDIESKFGVKASTYAGHQETDRHEDGYAPNPQHLNRGIDWVGSLDAMQKLAEYFMGLAPKTVPLEQVIWQNPTTGQKLGWAGRNNVSATSYFASDYPGHQDHVHLRASGPIGVVVEPPKVPATDPAATAATDPASTATATDPATTMPAATTPVAATQPTVAAEPSSADGSSTLPTWGELAGQAVTGQIDDAASFFGIKDTWMYDPSKLGISWGKKAETPTSTAPAAATEPVTNPAATPAIADPAAASPAPAATSAAQAAKKPATTSGWGQDFFVSEIAKAAKGMNLPERAAVTGTGTTLVEAGDPQKMWANSKVPESLTYRHDAVGSDGRSVGIFQQQPQFWGAVADLMNPRKSAEKFFDAMIKVNGWETMDMGALAQAVQRSAYPAKYGPQMGRAAELVKKTGVYDTGGVLPHGKLAMNLSGHDEYVVNSRDWKDAKAVLGPVRAGNLARPKVDMSVIDAERNGSGRRPMELHTHYHTEDVSEAVRESDRNNKRLMKSESMVGGR